MCIVYTIQNIEIYQGSFFDVQNVKEVLPIYLVSILFIKIWQNIL